MKTWVDLRGLEDLDVDDFQRAIRKGFAGRIVSLEKPVFAAVLDCVARAEDTTREQEQLLRDALASLG